MTVDMQLTHVNKFFCPSVYTKVQYIVKDLLIRWLNEICYNRKTSKIELTRQISCDDKEIVFNVDICENELDDNDIQSIKNILENISNDNYNYYYEITCDDVYRIINGSFVFLRYHSYCDKIIGKDIYDLAVAICVLYDYMENNDISYNDEYNSFYSIIESVILEYTICDDIANAEIYFG